MPHPSLLIVDDDLGTRATFGTAFTLAGVSAQTTDSGSNALVVTKAQNFDLLLVDFRMPDMNGMEVIRRLRDERRAMPFVLMTAFPTVELAVDAMELLITYTDAVYPQLRIWFDRNHDGHSGLGELVSLDEVGIVSISLAVTEGHKRDRFGNLFRYRSVVKIRKTDGTMVQRFAYDVYLVSR